MLGINGGKMQQLSVIFRNKQGSGYTYSAKLGNAYFDTIFIEEKANENYPDIEVKKDKSNIYSLWRKTGKNGTEYYSGKYGNDYIVGFKNKYKKSDEDKQPWLIVYFQEKGKLENAKNDNRDLGQVEMPQSNISKTSSVELSPDNIPF